jgi:CsbD-like
MNWDRVEGNWKQLTGKVKEQWGKLTDDDIIQINGNREQLAATLSSSRSVAAIRSRRFSARCLASAPLRHAISRSPG